MSNSNVTKACVLISRIKIEEALAIAKDGDLTGPKGIAIRIKKESGMDADRKRQIDINRIQLVAVYYDNNNLRGAEVALGAQDLELKALNGASYGGGKVEWEHADTYTVSSRVQDEPDIDFSFSFFQYDMVNLIIEKWRNAGEICQTGLFENFLLGSVQINLGVANGSASAIYGDSFELKLEPYCEMAVPRFEPVNLGIPLYAIGFGCRKNWHKIEVSRNELTPIISNSMNLFVDSVEQLFEVV